MDLSMKKPPILWGTGGEKLKDSSDLIEKTFGPLPKEEKPKDR